MSDSVKVEKVTVHQRPWWLLAWHENGEPCEMMLREGGPMTVPEAVTLIERRLAAQSGHAPHRNSNYDDRDQT